MGVAPAGTSESRRTLEGYAASECQSVSFEIEDVPLPEPDGRAPRGPNLHALDREAIAGINAGVFADPHDAAKKLAPKYRPTLWPTLSPEQRRDVIKAKRK